MTLPEDYPALLAGFDAWHAGAQARHPGVIPCRSGCSACCHGPFDISVADARMVRDAVGALAPRLREEIRGAAAAQMDAMVQIEPGLAAPWDIAALGEERFDALAEAFIDAPCPALDRAGACRIYHHRPMICRMMGLGLVTPDGQVIENDCPIQGQYPEYESLPPQAFDLDGWEGAEADALIRAAQLLFGDGEHSGYETTVAGAILLDVPGAVSP